jgi:hypothetical protein
MLLFFIIFSVFMTIVSIVFIIKNSIKYEAIKEIYKYNRIGFIDKSGSYTPAFIEYEELERFKNGFSRVKIISIKAITTDSDKCTKVKENTKAYFKDIVRTDSIEWLERDEDLMEVRRKKLERLIK